MRHRPLLDRYLAYVGCSRTPATVSAHRGKLQPLLLTAWDHLDTKDFTRAAFEAYVKEGNTHWKPRTLQMLMDYARAFQRWCVEEGIECPDFVGKMPKPRVHLGKVVFYTEEELALLLEGAKNDRLSVVIVAGAYLGCRKTEIWNMDWSDVSWEERVVTIHGTKVGRDREVPMSETCYRVLRSYWRNQKSGRVMGDYPWFSINVWRDLTRLCKRVGVTPKGVHALRRSFATHLLGKGADVGTTKTLGGWTSLATVSRYAGTTTQRLKAAVALLG